LPKFSRKTKETDLMSQVVKSQVTVTLTERTAARYLKVHVKFDDRDTKFKARDKASFLNDFAKLLRIYQEATSRTEEFTYDAAGNRTLQRLTLVQTNSYMSNYYSNSDRLKTDGKYAFKYDAAGNMTEKGNQFTINGDTVTFTTSGDEVEYWKYKYDLLNRLIAVTKNGTLVAEYEYDPEGLRVVKKAKGVTTHYVFEGTEPIFEKKITTRKIKSYVYAVGKYLARVDGTIGDATAKKYFYHTDHLGSIRAVTNQAGKVVYKADYLAFGTRFGEETDGEFDEEHGFTGKEYDPDTGLYYYNARWYDADLGRFISEDPAADPNNPNLYSYCGNNPINSIDPTGCYGSEAFDPPDSIQLPDSYVRPDDDYDSGSDDDDDDGETQEEREKKAFERVVKNTEPSSSILGKFGVTGGIVHELCEDLYNIALVAGVVSKLNNPVSLITFLAKEGKPLVEAELKVAGIIISGTKQERNELLNSIKNALGEEFVQPFIDVARDFNKMVSGQKLSGKEQFELGRDLYQCTMTAIMAYSAIRAAGKLGAKLARSMSKLTKEGGALSKLSAVVRDQRGGVNLSGFGKGATKTGQGPKSVGNLTDGMTMNTNAALDEASTFLGKGYKDMGGGRFVSADGTRQVRLGDSDILGQHGGASHINFETLVPNPAKPGKMMVDTDLHIFIK
jgi:RHS repeat-associated protein